MASVSTSSPFPLWWFMMYRTLLEKLLLPLGTIVLLLVITTHRDDDSALPATTDIAVAAGDEIHFLNSSGHVMAQISEEMKHMRALAYNPELQHIYFSDIEQSQYSVLKLTIPEQVTDVSNRQVVIKPLVTKQPSKVQGVAFDHVTHILYWTTGNGSSIKWLKISESEHQPQPGSILLEFQEDVPVGIVVDTCRRYLYWTNCNLMRPSIERSLLDGSGREVVVNTDLSQPHGIAIDQTRRRIYWTNVAEGFDFRLESADLNGEDRKLIFRSNHQEPFALAISGNSLYWTDWTNDAIWQLPLDETQDKIEPVKVRGFTKTPAGIVSSSQQIVDQSQCKSVTDVSQMQNDGPLYVSTDADSVTIQPPEKNLHDQLSVYCLNQGIEKNSTATTTRECKCLPGYSGERCEIFVCHNYCIHGDCSADLSGSPKCKCQHGWTGNRCEMDTCDNYCLNDGRCYKLSTDVTAAPMCECAPRYEGVRCEQFVGGDIQEFCDKYCKNVAINSETVVVQTSQFCRCENTGEELSNVSVAVAHVIDSSGSCMWRDLNDSIRMILILICLILIVAVVVLVRQICQLRKRPRIKKRIIVNKSVTPLTSRPQPDQCEITIENCCNMNICETPCFEPEFRTPLRSNGKKEEKKNLLTSIELPPDDLY